MWERVGRSCVVTSHHRDDELAFARVPKILGTTVYISRLPDDTRPPHSPAGRGGRRDGRRARRRSRRRRVRRSARPVPRGGASGRGGGVRRGPRRLGFRPRLRGFGRERVERLRERAFRVHGSERRVQRGPPVRGRRGGGPARGGRGGGEGGVFGTAGTTASRRFRRTRRRWRVGFFFRRVRPVDVRRRVAHRRGTTRACVPTKQQKQEPRHAPRREAFGAKPRVEGD